jgi:hypothetical protein
MKRELGYDFTGSEIQQIVFERNSERTDKGLEEWEDSLGNIIAGLVGMIGGIGIEFIWVCTVVT